MVRPTRPSLSERLVGRIAQVRRASAAQRLGTVPFALGRARMGGRGRCMGASRWRACARAAVGRAGRALGRTGFLGVFGERHFGFHLSRRQWAGAIVTAFGLAVIAITGRRHTSAVRHYSLAALIGWSAASLRSGRADRDLDARQRRPGRGGTAARRCGRAAVRGIRHRAEVPHRSLTRGAAWIVSEWTLAALAASVLRSTPRRAVSSSGRAWP
jgi:hypothetical protein